MYVMKHKIAQNIKVENLILVIHSHRFKLLNATTGFEFNQIICISEILNREKKTGK